MPGTRLGSPCQVRLVTCSPTKRGCPTGRNTTCPDTAVLTPALPDDLLNFHFDPVACAVALGWQGAEIEAVQIEPVFQGEMLRFRVTGKGLTRLVVDVDGDAFAETWLVAAALGRASAMTSPHSAGAVACTSEQMILGEGPPAGSPVAASSSGWTSWPSAGVYRDRVDHDGALIPVDTYQVAGTVGAVAPIDGDEGWLLAAGRRFLHLSLDRSLRPVTDDVAPSGVRMNDAGMRSAGPVLGGHRGPPCGRCRPLPPRWGQAC